MAPVERRDRGEVEAFGEDDQAGVGGAEVEIGVLLDQDGDPLCARGNNLLDLEIAAGDGAEEAGFGGCSELPSRTGTRSPR